VSTIETDGFFHLSVNKLQFKFKYSTGPHLLYSAKHSRPGCFTSMAKKSLLTENPPTFTYILTLPVCDRSRATAYRFYNFVTFSFHEN
jgi:hypothetical protein